MKKLGILMMPLMVMSILASCGGNSKKPVNPLKIDLYKKEIEYDDIGKNVVFTTEYEYNNKGLCVKDTRTRTNDPNYKSVSEHTYDKHENKTCSHSIAYNGEEIIEQTWMRYDYTYSKQGRITKQETKVSSDNKEWELIEYYVVEYKENVNVIENYNRDGSLDYTTTLTFDKKGNLINEKTVYNRDLLNSIQIDDWEQVYTVDKNGCATKIQRYTLSSSTGEREELTEVIELTYLNNLWYRPLKETTAYCESGEPHSYITTISEYDKKNRITLSKSYRGIEEGESPYYYSYSTYEY